MRRDCMARAVTFHLAGLFNGLDRPIHLALLGIRESGHKIPGCEIRFPFQNPMDLRYSLVVPASPQHAEQEHLLYWERKRIEGFREPDFCQGLPRIGLFHTGGTLGRHELDDTREVNWHAVANAIADTGYTGLFSHELVLARTPIKSLEQAYRICTV
jgi:hypothetical protein